MKIEFPSCEGLEYTTLGPQLQFTVHGGEFVQILHTRTVHWITISNVGCRQGTINYFDSLYRKVSSQSLKQIACIMFVNNEITIDVIPVQMQQNGTDCGLFAIAFATSILHGEHPAIVKYDQMRSHFVKCIKAGRIENFPKREGAVRRGRQEVLKIPISCSCRLPITPDEKSDNTIDCCPCLNPFL